MIDLGEGVCLKAVQDHWPGYTPVYPAGMSGSPTVVIAGYTDNSTDYILRVYGRNKETVRSTCIDRKTARACLNWDCDNHCWSRSINDLPW